jgi:hypothetical protein
MGKALLHRKVLSDQLTRSCCSDRLSSHGLPDQVSSAGQKRVLGNCPQRIPDSERMVGNSSTSRAPSYCSAVSQFAEAHSQLLHAFNTTNASRQIGAEETAVGGLVCEPTHGTETLVDGARCQLTGFEMRPIAQHHYPVESQARFRTIPVNELIDGVTITPVARPGW